MQDNESAVQEVRKIQPTYYVMHPDGSYSVADPQPTLPDAAVRDMRMLRDILLIGGDGEPLVISSELETCVDGFGDTLMRFEVRNPEGRSRYGVCVTVTRLRVEA